MSEHKYTIAEVDRLRRAVRRLSAHDVTDEEQVRTYMAAGIRPDSLEAEINAREGKIVVGSAWREIDRGDLLLVVDVDKKGAVSTRGNAGYSSYYRTSSDFLSRMEPITVQEQEADLDALRGAYETEVALAAEQKRQPYFGRMPRLGGYASYRQQAEQEARFQASLASIGAKAIAVGHDLHLERGPWECGFACSCGRRGTYRGLCNPGIRGCSTCGLRYMTHGAAKDPTEEEQKAASSVVVRTLFPPRQPRPQRRGFWNWVWGD